MTLRAWLWLLWRETVSEPGRHVLLVACLALTGILFGITLSVVVYLRSEVRPRLREMFPEKRVIVRPRTGDLFLFRFQGSGITDADVEEFRSLSGVAAAHPQLAATFPVSAEFSMESMDIAFSTDIILYGVDEAMTAASVPGGTLPARDDRVPVLISEYFLEAYNMGLAESAGMPRLSRQAVLGIEFDLLLGESSVGLGSVDAPPQRLPARVVGLTPETSLLGVTVPLKTLAGWNAIYAPDKKCVYTMLHVDAGTPEAIPTIIAHAEGKGFAAEARAKVLDQYLRIAATIELVVSGLFAAVLALSSVGIFTTMGGVIRSRRPVWGLHRATGLGRRGVLVLACGHAAAAAVPSMLLAAGGCALLSRLLDNFAGEYIRNSSILPGNPLEFTPIAMAATALFLLVLAFVPAMIFALPAMCTRPIRLLAQRAL